MAYKTNLTASKRDQLKHVMDEFTTFSWNNRNMFEEFGAFIINDKREGLHFFNGPSFSNEYSKPQFESATGHLLGVNFEVGKLPTLKIGLYWFSIQEYREFLAALDPYEVGLLIFSFEPNYGYQVKVAKIGDSVRYIMGHENGEPRYYTELNLEFELQGEPCARAVIPYEWTYQSKQSAIKSDSTEHVSTINEGSKPPISSDLDMPFIYTFTISPSADEGTKQPITLETIGSKQLFTLVLNNLSYKIASLTFSYDSQEGLIYLIQGSERKLLTLQTTTTTGDYLVDSLQISKFKFLGHETLDNYQLLLTTPNALTLTSIDITAYARTNTL